MLNLQKRKWIITQIQTGKMSVMDIARSQQVSRKTVYQLFRRYQQKGLSALEDKPALRGY